MFVFDEIYINSEKTINEHILNYVNDLTVEAREMTKQCNYHKAQYLFEKAFAVQEAFFDPYDLLLVKTMIELSSVLHNFCNYEEALSLLKRALFIQETVFGEHHEQVGLILNNIGTLLKDQGHISEALTFFKRDMYIIEHTLGTHNIEYSSCVNNIAAVLQDQGDFEQAMYFYNISLEIDEVYNTEQYPITLCNVASLFKDMNFYEESYSLFLKAIDLIKHTMGTEHTMYSFALNGIAFLYYQYGNLDESKYIYEQVINIDTKLFGENHPIVIHKREIYNIMFTQTTMCTTLFSCLSSVPVYQSTRVPEYQFGCVSSASLVVPV